MNAPANAPAQGARWSKWVLDVSTLVLRGERLAILLLMGLLMALVLLNVVTRYSGYPIYWIDEAAVYTVVWLCFVGGSAMSRLRMDFAVTLLTEHLGPRGVQLMKVLATVGVLLFGIGLMAMCWIWMDPVGFARNGFDAKAFAGASFNFLYTERTQTLNWPTWVLQTVLPLFAATLTLHALANLIEDLGWQPRRDYRHLLGNVGDAEMAVN